MSPTWPATTSRCRPLEHRRRPAGQRGLVPDSFDPRQAEPLARLGRNHADFHGLLRAVFFINFGLLLFNFLPIYPLDGGQILRSLLWYPLGRARSLLVATSLSFVGIAAFIGLAIYTQSLWTGAIAVFMLLNCWGGLQQARALLRIAKLPRREDIACPACKAAPPVGDLWKCAQCAQPFDIFQHQGTCPVCGAQFPVIRCMECGAANPLAEWATSLASVSSTFRSEVRS